MEINTYLDRLANGILSNLSLAENGVINPKQIPKIVSVIEEGLLDLYSRFLLKENSLLLGLSPYITMYELTVGHNASGATSICDPIPPNPQDPPGIYEGGFGDKYILDTYGEPYFGDFIKPLSVYTDSGVKLPMEDLHHPFSVFFPQPRTIQVPKPDVFSVLNIEYQASHPQFCITKENDGYAVTGNLELPTVLIPHLNLFVGSKVLGYMNSQENTAKSLEYLQEYERQCEQSVERDIVSTSKSFTNSLFEHRGWI